MSSRDSLDEIVERLTFDWDRAKLEEVIAMIQDHYDQTGPYNRMMANKFTYENIEFESCLVCGHSDKAIIYELNKALKLLKAQPPKTLLEEELKGDIDES